MTRDLGTHKLTDESIFCGDQVTNLTKMKSTCPGKIPETPIKYFQGPFQNFELIYGCLINAMSSVWTNRRTYALAHS